MLLLPFVSAGRVVSRCAMANRALSNAFSLARSALRTVAKTQRLASRRSQRSGSGGGARGRVRPRRPSQSHQDGGYAGDFRGTPRISYTPVADDLPDPGEVVWTWVPYEEDYRQGKDRPVLVIGRHAGLLLALQLTSKDHDRDAESEARSGRFWIDVGTGEWDRDRRRSEARVDRVLQLDPAAVRRIGAVLAEPIFAQVAAQVTRRAAH